MIINRFWRWFFCGLHSKKPGILKFIDRWMILHCIIGCLLSHYVGKNLYEAATTVLLPAASIFTGLSFAWAGSAQALMQDQYLEVILEKNANGVEEYLYTFQSAILVIIITIVLWIIASLNIFVTNKDCLIFFSKIVLYTFSSISVRECWQVVVGINVLSVIRNANFNKTNNKP